MYVYSSGMARVLFNGTYSTYQFRALKIAGVNVDEEIAAREKGMATKLMFAPECTHHELMF